MSPGTNVAAKAASLIKASRYRARASRLSRGAATDFSHGCKPVGRCRFEWSPVGAKESQEICRPSGAYRHIGRKTTGLRPWLRSVAAPRLTKEAARYLIDV